jgi:dethiobiotin synthetase
MLSAVGIRGLLVTGTDTDVGKTVIAGAIAAWFAHQNHRVGVFKPMASGCVKRREGLISEDAEFLAHCADAADPLDLIAPLRYLEPLAPAVAAQRLNEPADWSIINRALQTIGKHSEVTIVEGIGGVEVPMDDKHTMLDVARWLNLPAVIVARAQLGTINHTLLTVNALRGAGVRVAGVVINRYPAESATVAEETNPRSIEKWGRVPVLCLVPDVKMPPRPMLHPDIVAAIATVDWWKFI